MLAVSPFNRSCLFGVGLTKPCPKVLAFRKVTAFKYCYTVPLMAMETPLNVANGSSIHDPRRAFQVVVAFTREMGIGKDGKLPWRLSSDLKFFKEVTMSTSDPLKKNAVIMGRKTWESIPTQNRPLPGRLNVVLTRSGSFDIATAENVVICGSMNSALDLLAASPYCFSTEKVFVIGGGEILREALNAPGCEAIHFTDIETSVDCDTFIPPIDLTVFQPWYSSFPVVENKIRYSFTTYVRVRRSAGDLNSLQNGETTDIKSRTDKFEIEQFSFLPKMIFERHEEYMYLRLVQDIIANGAEKNDRTGTGTLSKFGCQMRFNLRRSFPLLTTKKVFWRGVVEELLWFINGSTNAKVLQEKGIHIWNGNASREYLDRYTDMHANYSGKGFAATSEETVRSQMFDMVLLCQKGKNNSATALREAKQNEVSKNSQQNSNPKGLIGKAAGRGKKQTKMEVEVVDLRTLLIHCAQAVAAYDRRSANELLKQIRQFSSPFGDGSQRLAHCFADGLEARLAGTGSQIYQSLVSKRATATDILKAYQLYLAACPFKRISHFFSNQTILGVAANAPRLHIIDFGIYFGFQWPCLIQRLSSRAEGPPKLRITGIDVPQPGFRPTERIEETGKRLADYARSFGVPFEYNAIASKWETIRVEDLKIDKDEVVVVNCLYRFRNLVDETVVADSPRNMVLNTIRKANPDVFIHGIVNGSYSAPFFVTRFREALFHFSALFDMLETNVTREDEQRLLIERDLFGREALNVISCEGSERVERPETYKQWQVRNLRAGFTQQRLNPEIVNKARDKVKGTYHKDFVIDEDSRWLLQGWKGRIIYAISTWKPNRA